MSIPLQDLSSHTLTEQSGGLRLQGVQQTKLHLPFLQFFGVCVCVVGGC